MSEVVEMLLTVQRQWMYLESIFMSSEDIRKQLPEEAVLFDQVNDDYKAITKAIVEEPNAIKATHRENTLENLTKWTSLPKIQKSLDQYLETKRQFFPRFYFLSNDDLLEILGQQKGSSRCKSTMKKMLCGC